MDDFEKQHIDNVTAAQQFVFNLYVRIIAELTLTAARTPFNGKDTQKIQDYPVLWNQLNSLISGLKTDLQIAIVTGIETAFSQSQVKNDELVRSIVGNVLLMHPAINQAFSASTAGALQAFVNRTEDGLNLSARIYQMAAQFQSELEQSLALQIQTGMSAKRATTMIKQFLLEPDKLFRRVKDSTGKLVLSKAARAYNPGQGVYRSSYKNALRLTRTETNIAYRKADFSRWQTLPFVVGIDIQVSESHPLTDECDELAGQYPKDFEFSGWHPQCLCYQVPIMATKDEQEYITDQLLAGKQIDPDQIKQVSQIPEKAQNYIDKNTDRISKFASTPYWVRDNFKDRDIKKGLAL